MGIYFHATANGQGVILSILSLHVTFSALCGDEGKVALCARVCCGSSDKPLVNGLNWEKDHGSLFVVATWSQVSDPFKIVSGFAFCVFTCPGSISVFLLSVLISS